MSILNIFKRAQGPRELVLDTESTGLFISEGHRMVEIAVVEMVNNKPTGREYHVLINPDRHIPEEVVKIHGIDDAAVKDKPKFSEIAKELRAFIGDDPVVITCRTTNDYTLDIALLNLELTKAGEQPVPESQWKNVRRWSEAMFGDKQATLDKVLDKYGISRKERDENGHGALLDARLLAEAYPQLKKDYAAHTKALEKKPQQKQPKA